MLLHHQCIPCILKQAEKAAETFAPDNERLRKSIVSEIGIEAMSIDQYDSVPHFSAVMQDVIERATRLSNPWQAIKETNLEHARAYVDHLRTAIDKADDPLRQSVITAILGNTIDIAANPDFDLDEEITRLRENQLILDRYPAFKAAIESAETILYIGDNYEEALFDMELLKRLNHKDLTFAVRSRAVFNDITMNDAKRLGIDNICRVIESGSAIAGTDIHSFTNEFAELYQNAGMVIAKGQGNLESLLEETRPIFFLLKIKCDVIAERTGYPKGKGVLLYGPEIKP